MKRYIFFPTLVYLLSTMGLTAQTMIEEKGIPAHRRDNFSGSLLFLSDNINLVSYNKREMTIRIRNLDTRAMDSIRPTIKWANSYIENIVATHNGSKIIVQVTAIHSPEKNYNSGFLGGGDSIWQFETTLFCYSLPGKKLLWNISTGSKSFDALLISPDDHVLCGVAHMGSNKFFDPETGRSLERVHHFPNGDGKNIVQSQDGRLVLFWNRAGYKTVNLRAGSRLELWDFDKGKQIASKFVRGKGVWAAAFRNDEKSVFSGSSDGSVQEWSLTDDKLSPLLKDSTAIANLAFPGSGRNGLAVNAFRTDRLSVYSYPDMKPTVEFFLSGDNFTIGGGAAPRFAFSNDGRYFGLYHHDGTISIYRTDDWRLFQ